MPRLTPEQAAEVDASAASVEGKPAYRKSDARILDLLDALQQANERAEKAESMLNSAGIAELATRNPSIMDYMGHWEGRAEQAEKDRAVLAKVLRLCEPPDWLPEQGKHAYHRAIDEMNASAALQRAKGGA